MYTTGLVGANGTNLIAWLVFIAVAMKTNSCLVTNVVPLCSQAENFLYVQAMTVTTIAISILPPTTHSPPPPTHILAFTSHGKE